MLEVRDVTVAFDGTTVLRDASLSVGDAEVVALLGPSGSGKSTLLRVIAGLVVPASGSVHLDGRDITRSPTHRRGIGMVFQDDQLFPHRDVAANIGFGLKMQGIPAPDRERRVATMLDLVGLAGFGRRHVTDLSGGEAKRVALARSLAPAPHALLLDEPLTGLDRELHDRLAGELGRILRKAATTTLIVTHDRDEASTLADRVVAIDELTGPFSVVELRAEDTHPLRAAVLRNDTPSRELVLDGDDEASTVHLGVRDRDGGLIGVSTWLRRPPPGDDGPGVQLRAMATATIARGQGAGDVLLAAGIARTPRATTPDTVVWARARDSALGFYVRHGFEVVEPGFVDETTAQPHHVILLRPR